MYYGNFQLVSYLLPTFDAGYRQYLTNNLSPRPCFAAAARSLLFFFFPCFVGSAGKKKKKKADPGRSIPKGTLAAIATVTATYVVFIWMFGTIMSNEVLIGDKLVASRVAWPTHYLVSVGN